MNFEGLEQLRFECTEKVMRSMTELACDETKPVDERFKAAKVIDVYSDAIIAAYLAKNGMDVADNHLKSHKRGLDKLNEQ